MSRDLTFARIRDSIDQIRPKPEWSWRSTADPGTFELWTRGEAVGTVCLLPSYVQRRAVLMDTIVDHLNQPD